MRRLRLFSLYLLATLHLSAASAFTDSLTRAVYLQRISQTEAIIRWRSAGASDSVVLYGTDIGALTQRAEDSTSTTEHRVTISGLSSGTKYYYTVGSTVERLTVADASYHFVTNPSSGKSTRIWALGDSGRGNAEAYSVKQGYLNFIQNDGRKADLWLMLGDNAYTHGLDNEYQTGLFDVYPEVLKNTALWPTLGNHDGSAKDLVVGEIPYYASFSLPRNGEVGGVASGTESYYSFDYGDIHFICLNSYDEDRSATGSMATWLKQDLAASAKKWMIAFWHHPPYSKGTHDSDTEVELVEMRQNILPILEEQGVDLVLAGHSHNYERSFLIDGHYGVSSTFNVASKMKLDGGSGEVGYRKPPQIAPHRGAVYVVNGTGSAVGGGALNHPVFYTNKSLLGSMIIDIDGDKLQARFIKSDGNTEDFFEVSKEPEGADVLKQKILAGRGSGKLATLKESDTKGVALGALRDDKSGKYFYRVDYQFTLSDLFYRRILKLRAGKLSPTSPDLFVSVSSDGKRFKKVTSITNLLKDSSVYSASLEGSGGGKLFVRIESKARSRASSRKEGGVVEFLRITNG